MVRRNQGQGKWKVMKNNENNENVLLAAARSTFLKEVHPQKTKQISKKSWKNHEKIMKTSVKEISKKTWKNIQQIIRISFNIEMEMHIEANTGMPNHLHLQLQTQS